MATEHDAMEPMQLSDAMLEGVVGGLDELPMKAVVYFVKAAKRNGLTLDQAIDRALHPKRGSVHFDDEMIQYMTEYWNGDVS